MNPSSPTETEFVPPKKMDDLISDISRLMAEAEEMLSESTSNQPEVHLELFRERNAAVGNRVMAGYATAKGKLAAAARTTDQVVRTYPYESVALALGLGVMVGACLRRRSV